MQVKPAEFPLVSRQMSHGVLTHAEEPEERTGVTCESLVPGDDENNSHLAAAAARDTA